MPQTALFTAHRALLIVVATVLSLLAGCAQTSDSTIRPLATATADSGISAPIRSSAAAPNRAKRYGAVPRQAAGLAKRGRPSTRPAQPVSTGSQALAAAEPPATRVPFAVSLLPPAPAMPESRPAPPATAARTYPWEHVATLQFAEGDARLGERERQVLQAVATLQQQRASAVRVVGHARTADASANDEAADPTELSTDRAFAVAAELGTHGVPRPLIAVEGHGASEPLYEATTVTGAAGNRRAEIFLRATRNTRPAMRPREWDTAIVSTDSAEVAANTDAWRRPPVAVAAAENTASSLLDPLPEPTATAAGKTCQDCGTHVATIRFGSGSASLSKQDRQRLAEIAAMQRERGGVIRIAGHASRAVRAGITPERAAAANQRISEARASSVAEALAALGVATDDLATVGKGASEPLGDASDDNNRRAEIYIDFEASVRLAEAGAGQLP
jgi:outer membrane protein OmpA-like peptidoglycan-associated protein